MLNANYLISDDTNYLISDYVNHLISDSINCLISDYINHLISDSINCLIAVAGHSDDYIPVNPLICLFVRCLDWRCLGRMRCLLSYAQFGSDLDGATQYLLNRGEQLTEALNHAQYNPK